MSEHTITSNAQRALPPAEWRPGDWLSYQPRQHSMENPTENDRKPDVSDANGSVYARLKWWKDRADDDADEIQRLREGIDCATNALTDSILCSGNDAATNMHFVRKLKALLSGPNTEVSERLPAPHASIANQSERR